MLSLQWTLNHCQETPGDHKIQSGLFYISSLQIQRSIEKDNDDHIRNCPGKKTELKLVETCGLNDPDAWTV